MLPTSFLHCTVATTNGATASREGGAEGQLQPSAAQVLKTVFDKIDTDGSGTISLEEFKQACDRLSFRATEEELNDFCRSDASGDCEVNFGEFCQFYLERLHKVFNELDTDGSGEIEEKEIISAFERIGVRVTEREVRSLLSEIDQNKSGTVDFAEFCDFFCHLPSPNVRSVMEMWASGLSMDTGESMQKTATWVGHGMSTTSPYFAVYNWWCTV